MYRPLPVRCQLFPDARLDNTKQKIETTSQTVLVRMFSSFEGGIHVGSVAEKGALAQ